MTVQNQAPTQTLGGQRTHRSTVLSVEPSLRGRPERELPDGVLGYYDVEFPVDGGPASSSWTTAYGLLHSAPSQAAESDAIGTPGWSDDDAEALTASRLVDADTETDQEAAANAAAEQAREQAELDTLQRELAAVKQAREQGRLDGLRGELAAEKQVREQAEQLSRLSTSAKSPAPTLHAGIVPLVAEDEQGGREVMRQEWTDVHSESAVSLDRSTARGSSRGPSPELLFGTGGYVAASAKETWLAEAEARANAVLDRTAVASMQQTTTAPAPSERHAPRKVRAGDDVGTALLLEHQARLASESARDSLSAQLQQEREARMRVEFSHALKAVEAERDTALAAAEAARRGAAVHGERVVEQIRTANAEHRALERLGQPVGAEPIYPLDCRLSASLDTPGPESRRRAVDRAGNHALFGEPEEPVANSAEQRMYAAARWFDSVNQRTRSELGMSGGSAPPDDVEEEVEQHNIPKAVPAAASAGMNSPWFRAPRPAMVTRGRGQYATVGVQSPQVAPALLVGAPGAADVHGEPADSQLASNKMSSTGVLLPEEGMRRVCAKEPHPAGMRDGLVLLGFQQSDVLTLLSETTPEGWCLLRDSDGKEGWGPRQYVELIRQPEPSGPQHPGTCVRPEWDAGQVQAHLQKAHFHELAEIVASQDLTGSDLLRLGEAELELLGMRDTKQQSSALRFVHLSSGLPHPMWSWRQCSAWVAFHGEHNAANTIDAQQLAGAAFTNLGLRGLLGLGISNEQVATKLLDKAAGKPPVGPVSLSWDMYDVQSWLHQRGYPVNASVDGAAFLRSSNSDLQLMGIVDAPARVAILNELEQASQFESGVWTTALAWTSAKCQEWLVQRKMPNIARYFAQASLAGGHLFAVKVAELAHARVPEQEQRRYEELAADCERATWTSADVGKWLSKNGVPTLASEVELQGWDFANLFDLTTEELVAVGLDRVQHQAFKELMSSKQQFWGTEETCSWLEERKLSQISSLFRDQGLGGEDLCTIEKADLHAEGIPQQEQDRFVAVRDAEGDVGKGATSDGVYHLTSPAAKQHGADSALERIDVLLARTDQQTSFGFEFGTEMHSGTHIITLVQLGSIADAANMMKGDVIQRLNGGNVLSLSHSQLKGLVSAALSLTLSVERHTATGKANEVCLLNVRLQRESQATSYGFTTEFSASGKHLVRDVVPGSLAEGRLRDGDTILALDGLDVEGIGHDQIVRMIVSANEISLSIERRLESALADPRQSQIGRQEHIGKGGSNLLEFAISREDIGSSFGFGLGTDTQNNKVVSMVEQAGGATNKLRVGDFILEINGQSALTMTHHDAMRLLSIAGTRVRIRVMRRARVDALERKGSISALEPSRDIAFRNDSVGSIELAAGQISTVEVSIRRKDMESSYEFDVGTDEEEFKIVTDVTPGGVSDGILQKGDIIEKVDGSSARDLDQEALVERMLASTLVKLTLQRRVPDQLPLDDTADGFSKGDANVSVTLRRGDMQSSYGVGVGQDQNGAHLIARVSPTGVAADKVEVGDEIVAVNGVSTQGLEHAAVTAEMVRSRSVRLELIRRQNMPGTTPNRNESISEWQPDRQLLKRTNSIGSVQLPGGIPQRLAVVIQRPDATTSYGLGLAEDINGNHLVSQVEPGGLADGRLEVGDFVLSINGELTSALDHGKVLQAMTTHTVVELTVERRMSVGLTRRGSISKVDPTRQIVNRHDDVGRVVLPEGVPTHAMATIVRRDKRSSYGFGFGTDRDNRKFVSSVSPDGVSEDLLVVGDQLLTCNGHDTTSISHDELLQLLVSITSASFTIERRVFERRGSISTVDPSLQLLQRKDSIGSVMIPAGEPLTTEVVINRVDNMSSFGFGFGTDAENRKIVSKISPGTSADGKLYAGDVIELVDGHSATEPTHQALLDYMVAQTTLTLKVWRRIPADAIVDRRASISVADPTVILLDRKDDIGTVKLPAGDPIELFVELARPSMEQGFGFGLGTANGGQHLVTQVKSDGFAAGKLESGDQLLTIDGLDAATVSHADLNAHITTRAAIQVVVRRRVPRADRTVSFHVPDGEPMVLDAEVKRANNGSFGFGFGTSQSGDKLVSTVVAGSPAFGRLEKGDRLLAVNSEPVVDMSHAELLEKMKSVLSLQIRLERNVPAGTPSSHSPDMTSPPPPFGDLITTSRPEGVTDKAWEEEKRRTAEADEFEELVQRRGTLGALGFSS